MRVRIQVTLPGLLGSFELDRLAVFAEFNFGKRQLVGGEFLIGGFRQRGGEFRVIERWLPAALLGIDEKEFLRATFEIGAVPEARVVREPVRRDL